MEHSGDIVKFNALLEALVIVTKLFKQPFSTESLVAGLPVEEGKSSPELFTIDKAKSEFSRAANRAGLISNLVRKDLNEISPLVLPVILLLKDNSVCILTGFDQQKKHAHVIIPELGESRSWVSLEYLNAEYLGFAFYVKKKPKDEKIEMEDNIHLAQKKTSLVLGYYKIFYQYLPRYNHSFFINKLLCFGYTALYYECL